MSRRGLLAGTTITTTNTTTTAANRNGITINNGSNKFKALRKEAKKVEKLKRRELKRTK